MKTSLLSTPRIVSRAVPQLPRESVRQPGCGTSDLLDQRWRSTWISHSLAEIPASVVYVLINFVPYFILAISINPQHSRRIIVALRVCFSVCNYRDQFTSARIHLNTVSFTTKALCYWFLNSFSPSYSCNLFWWIDNFSIYSIICHTN